VLILDGYQFDRDYQQKIKAQAYKIIYVDDYLQKDYVADVVINHTNGFDTKALENQKTQFYFGSDYLLLRKAFIEVAQNKTHTHSKDRSGILVCMGGADPQNDILEVLKKVFQQKIKETVYLIIGPNKKIDTATLALLQKYQKQIVLLQNLNAQEMIDLMKKCATAILPPSTIAYEYLCIGGMLYLKQIADNQKHIKSYLLNNCLAVDFESFPVHNDKNQANLLKNQKQVFNGQSHQHLRNIVKQQLI